MAFDIEGARSAGYSDAEIADHLAASRQFDAEAARKSGYSDAELIAHLSATPDAPAPGVRDTARGAAVGVTDIGANVGNILSDPFGNLIGRPLAILGGTAYDAGARVFGYPPIPDKLRNELYGHNDPPQPGSRAVNALGGLIGADPSKVDLSPVGNEVRSAVGSAGTAAALSPGASAPIMGAAGALVGDALASIAPEWSKDALRFAGNVAGAYGASKATTLATKAGNAIMGNTSPLVETYRRLGIDHTLIGDVTGNPGAKTLQAFGSQSPFGASRIQPIEQKVVGQFGDAVEQTAAQLGTSRHAQAAGAILQDEARNWRDTVFPQRQAAAWAPVDKAMTGQPVEPTAYRGALSALTSKLAALPETQKVLMPPRVQTMLDAINADVPAGGSMPWQQAQSLRTAIGEIMGIPEVVQSVGKKQLNAAYGGIASDMRAAATAHGAERLFADANAVSTAGHAFIDQTLSKVIKSNNPMQETIAPERAADTVLRGGDRTLEAIRRELPHAADELAAYKLRDMALATPGRSGATGAETSVSTFLTDLNKLRQDAPLGHRALYDGAIGQRVSDLATVADSIRDTAAKANTSRTGPYNAVLQTIGSGGAGFAAGGFPGLAAGLAFPYAVNKLAAYGASSPGITALAAAPGPRVPVNSLVPAVAATIEAEQRRNRLLR